MKALVGAILAAALTSGCSSIWSRGLVQDEQGKVLQNVSVSVKSVAPPEAWCGDRHVRLLSLPDTVHKGQRRFGSGDQRRCRHRDG